MPGLTAEDDLATVTTLRGAIMRLGRRLRHQRVDCSLSSTEMSVLATLVRGGPATPSELARNEHMRPPSMTRILTMLTDKQLVRREPDPRDGRQMVVTATDTATEILTESRRQRDAFLAELAGELTEQEWAAIRAAAPALERLAHL
ncbi:MAG: MarR family transcriptional regulator [Nocardia sp.]|nr:MarR family transcriptional regulator [Nocardia sp.]